MELIEDAAGIRGREVLPRVIPVTQPAAGAEWSVSIPGGSLWIVQTIRATFTTSAVVANRGPRLAITDGSATVFRIPPTAVLAASGTNVYNWLRGLGVQYGAGVTQEVAQPFPSIPLYGGWIIGSSTGNLDAGDQWQSVVLHVLEVWERPYDVELARDVAQLRGSLSNAYPTIPEGL